jgi:hypothetical protein
MSSMVKKATGRYKEEFQATYGEFDRNLAGNSAESLRDWCNRVTGD